MGYNQISHLIDYKYLKKNNHNNSLILWFTKLTIIISIIFANPLLIRGNIVIYTSHIFILLACIFYFFVFITNKNSIITYDLLNILLIIFGLSLVFSIKSEYSFYPNLLKLFWFIFCFFMYRILYDYISIKNITSILLIISISLTIRAFFEVLQYDISQIAFNNRINVVGLGGLNNFSYLIVVAILTKLHIINKKIFKLKYEILIYALLLFDLLYILIQFSRGGWITLFLSITIYYFSSKDIKLINYKFLLFVSITVIVLYFFNIRYGLLQKVLERFLMLLNDQGTGRLLLWFITLNEISNFSLFELFFGRGLGSFNFELFNKYYDSAHNMFLQLLYEAGLISIIIFIIIFIYIFYRFQKESNSSLLLSILVVFFLCNFFDSHLYVSQTTWIYSLYFAFLTKTNKKNKDVKPLNDI